jgi:hypothetical protein
VWLAIAFVLVSHQTSVKYVDLVLAGDRVDVTLRFAPGDVTEAMGLPNDATPSLDAALGHAAVAPYVQRWLVLAGCPAGAPAIRADERLLAVTWTATCARAQGEVELDLGAFFALDRRHEVLVRLTAPDTAPINTILRAGDSPATLRPGHSPSLLAWIRTGMDHIYGGLDHILFVIALLLVVMLRREDGWQLRAFAPTLRSTAIVVTAFTIAHSISLIAAALGWIELPSQLVESLIALSIAYTAAENIMRPDVRWRFALTFGFGLVHGLGFASQLAVLLPPTDVVVPLLCFNAGVEIGQLSIVLVALPAVYLVARAVGAMRYRRVALPIIASAIGLVGGLMFVERVFELRILQM